MVINATFNNISIISWRSVLLVEETGGPGEKSQVTDRSVVFSGSYDLYFLHFLYFLNKEIRLIFVFGKKPDNHIYNIRYLEDLTISERIRPLTLYIYQINNNVPGILIEKVDSSLFENSSRNIN
jgi:hypothetical protein